MAHQFKQNPVQGEVDTLPNGRRFQFNAGKWDLYTSTLPQNVTPVITVTSPIESESAPALPNSNKYWFKPSTSVMYYQYSGAWVAGSSGGGLDQTALDEVLATSATYVDAREADIRSDMATADAAAISAANGYTDGVDTAIRSDMASAITGVSQPIEFESAPSLPNSNKYWFKPSSSVLHYQYNDGNSTQWVEI